MKKIFFLAAFAFSALMASAAFHENTSPFGFQKAGAEHTILRPQHLLMPGGQQTARPQRVQSEAEPQSQLEASAWRMLEHENGSDWLCTQTFDNPDAWTYKYSDITVYNDKLEKQATVRFEVPEGEKCNAIQPFGRITTKFFDLKEKTWEMMVYVHCTTADYQGKNYIYIINNEGEILDRYEGYSAQWQEIGVSYNKETRLLIGRDNGEDFVVDVFKKAGWNGGPQLLHTFSVPIDLANYSAGPAVNAYSIDDKAYYTVNHYERTYDNGMTDTYMPIVREDNNYLVKIYDGNFDLVSTIKSPVQLSDDGYCMQTFGYFSYEDLSRNYNQDGSEKLDAVITTEYYLLGSNDDASSFGWTVYNQDNEKINEIGGNVFDWWKLNPIKGQPDQYAFYTVDEEGNGHIETWDFPEFKKISVFDPVMEDLPITTNFNRIPVGNSYDYVTSISQGSYDADKNVIGLVAWFTKEGDLDKRVEFNLGPDAQYFICSMTDLSLDPYLFNTDDGYEYMYLKKVSVNGSSNNLKNVIVIADEKGNTLRSFSPDDDFPTYSSCDVMVDQDGNPNLVIGLTSDDYVYQLSSYKLPFTKWPAGGDGSKENPYVITSAGDLKMIADNLNAYYVVANNIDFSRMNTGWEPIDNFGGTLDGQNHVFRNFYMNAENYAAGLFGYVIGGKVKNLVFDAPVIVPSTRTNYLGIVAAHSSGYVDFSNISIFEPVVESADYSGFFGTVSALAGSYVTAQQCYVSDVAIDLPKASNVGGIFGDARAGSVAKACYVSGDINAESSLGGVIGSTLADSYAINCHTQVNLTAQHSVGAILGTSNQRATVEKNFAEGSVVATGTDYYGKAAAGGVLGYLEPNWGGAGNSVACRYNLSGADVEGAGEKVAAHRIVGYTVNDFDWTEEDIQKGENFTEAGVLNNFSTAPEVDGMVCTIESVDGATLSAGEINQQTLASKLNMEFGNTVDAPWVCAADGRLRLFFESVITGIDDTLVPAETPATTATQGIFDLQGRKYDSITAPGLYIINGKKTLIK